MSITKKNVTNENWFRDLFINEAKPALERHSGTGGETGGTFSTEENEAGGLTYKVKVGDASGGNADLFYDNDKAKEQTEINLPNVETLIGYAFKDRQDIYATKLIAPKLKNIGISAFENCINLALTDLPENMSGYIANQAFKYCTNLKITHIPAGVTRLDGYCFQGCTGLTSITFKGTPTNLAYNAFRECYNLTTINVPWAEGEITEAPWGAQNATINYNYTEEG